MIQVLFSEIRVSALGDTPVLVLKEAAGPRQLAIWISAASAATILAGLEGDDPRHPATHDLMIDALATLDAVVQSVAIIDEEDGVYDAHLLVNGTAVTCRVSDGVALALRCGAPIYAADHLLDAAGDRADGAAEVAEEADDQVEQFREFLDTINPDDFTEGPKNPEG